MSTILLLDAVTTVSEGPSVPIISHGSHQKTFHVKVVGDGALTATVKVWVRNDEDDAVWEELAEVVLSGSDLASDGFAHEAPWGNYMASVTAITGTDAEVTCTMVR